MRKPVFYLVALQEVDGPLLSLGVRQLCGLFSTYEQAEQAARLSQTMAPPKIFQIDGMHEPSAGRPAHKRIAPLEVP